MSYSDILSRFKKLLPHNIGRWSLNTNPDMEAVFGIIRNEQEIGYSAIELIRSMFDRNSMGLPDHPKVLTLLSDWYEGKPLPQKSQKNVKISQPPP